MTASVASPAIAYQPVTSSQLAECGYDAEAKVLGIKFVGGGTYHYSNVPQETFDALMRAESVGKYFGSNIRGKFAYDKQPDVPVGVVFGLQQSQEPKYTSSSKNGRLVNRSTGAAIPDTEPVFIFRAKDRKAVIALEAYMQACDDVDHRAVVNSRLLAFKAFADANPDVMKEPDSSSLQGAGR